MTVPAGRRRPPARATFPADAQFCARQCYNRAEFVRRAKNSGFESIFTRLPVRGLPARALAYAQVSDSLQNAILSSTRDCRRAQRHGRGSSGSRLPFPERQTFPVEPGGRPAAAAVTICFTASAYGGRPSAPAVLEVTARDFSHFMLLDGRAKFDLPASGEYRLEVYRGFFFKPAVIEFSLRAEEQKRITVRLDPIAPDRQRNWIAADDHIHLMRAREDDELFLRWLEAEDLAVGNFLELQRQQDAAVQYGFGREARSAAAGFLDPLGARVAQPVLRPRAVSGPAADHSAAEYRDRVRQFARGVSFSGGAVRPGTQARRRRRFRAFLWQPAELDAADGPGALQASISSSCSSSASYRRRPGMSC